MGGDYFIFRPQQPTTNFILKKNYKPKCIPPVYKNVWTMVSNREMTLLNVRIQQ